jgi:hypothetical protein
MQPFDWRDYCRGDESPDYYEKEPSDDLPDDEGIKFRANGHAPWCICPACQEIIKKEVKK